MSLAPFVPKRFGHLVFLAVSLVVAFLDVSDVRPAVSPAVSCGTKKLVGAGRTARALLRCHASAVRRGDAVAADRVVHAGEALSKLSARLDATGSCTITGDAAVIAGDIDALVAAAVARLRPQPAASRCASDKLAATGDYARDLTRAFARDARRSDPARLDADQAAAVSRLIRAFFLSEERGGCLTTGDDGAIAQLVHDDAAARIRCRLLPCPAPVCGNQVIEASEQCDGETCPGGHPFYGPHGCFPPGAASECDCCAVADDLCYLSDESLSIPCCPGLACVIGPRQPHNTGGCAPACSLQSDCPPGSICFCGGCQGPYPPCAQQSDCASDRICVNGGCSGPFFFSCSPAEPCPPGWACYPDPQLCVPIECGP